MGLFGPSKPRIEAGTKVTVYTLENWKGDGTGGAPGEVMEVTSLYYKIIWENSGGAVSADDFDKGTRSTRTPEVRAWFQLRGEPTLPAPVFPADTWRGEEK